jgi:hypothetical protein
LELLVECESEEKKVKECVCWKGDDGIDSEWESALEEELVQHGCVVFWGH